MSQMGTLSKKNRALPFLPWVVLLICLGSTFLAWLVISGLAYQKDRNRFEEIALNLQNEIQDRVEHQVALAKSTAAFLGTVPNVSQREFNDFLARQGWPGDWENVGSISYIAHVPPNGLADFVKRARDGGVANIQVDMSAPARERDLALYRQPVVPQMKPAGSEVGVDSVRRTALDQAKESGQPTASSVTTLYRDRQNPQPAIIIYIPIYARTGVPATPEARRKSISGFIGVSIRISRVLDSLSQDKTRYASLEVFQSAGQDGSSPVYRTRDLRPDAQFNTVQAFTGVLKKWTTRFYSRRELEKEGIDDVSPAILLGGAILSLTFFLLTSSQVRNHREVKEYALEIERRAAAESLLAHAGTLLTDSENFESILGQIANLAVPSFCDWCAVDVLRGEEIVRLAFIHEDKFEMEAGEAIHRAFPPTLSDTYGVGMALRTGDSELFKTMVSADLTAAGLNAEQVDFVRSHGFHSAIIVPIFLVDKPFATFTFIVGTARRNFSTGDLRLVEEFVQRITLAFENRRLFHAARIELAEKQKAEEALRTLNDDLEDLIAGRTRELSVAVGELEAFCYSVSHDLRAPLRSVDGFSKAIIEDYGDRLDDDGVDYLVRIRAAAKRMDELITAMLTLSRLTRADIAPENVDVSEIAREVSEEATRENDASVLIQPGLCAYADPHMVRILFENLITNAIKFSSKVSSPVIEVGQIGLTFFVKDNGVGFDPRYSNKLFQPFERLHSPKEFPGTGIGLATSSRVVKRHGGNIWAESKPGEGATFFFTLTPEPSEASPLNAQDRQNPDLAPINSDNFEEQQRKIDR